MKNHTTTDCDHELDCWTYGGWDTDRHYRRIGSKGTIHFGNGEWITDWRRRMVSRDTLRMAVESGITIMVTHFYKGYGVRLDSTEWPRLKEYVRNCHEEGLKVWGYVQGQSMYQETFFAETPEAVDWVAKRYNGTNDYWAGAYWRLAPCMTAVGYRDYIMRVIETGLTEIGLDGIHLDNSYYKHCYCPRCRALFRDFLNNIPNLEELTGLPNADYVEPPPLPSVAQRIVDPLMLLWMEFGTQQRLAHLDALNRRIKEIRPDAIFHTNPAYPKRPAAKLFLALDPVREASVCDFVCAENGYLPRVENGKVFSQAEAYLLADAAGYRVLHTSWRESSLGSSPPETIAGLWTGLAEEFSYHAAILGNNWLLRATGDGDQMWADKSDWRETHGQATHFFRGLHRDLRLGNRNQWAEVGILVDPDTLTQAATTDIPAFRALFAHLLARRVPVLLILDEQPIPESIKALLVCQQSCLSETQLDRIRTFAERPGRTAWIAGETGKFNEWFVARNESRWRAWRQSPGFVADEGKPLRWAHWNETVGQYFGPDTFNITPDAMTQIDGFLDTLRDRMAFHIEAPEHIYVNTETTGDGRLLVHLRDQAGSGKPISGVRVRLGSGLVTEEPVILYQPGTVPQELEPVVQAREHLFLLSEFNHYALLVAHLSCSTRRI